MNTPSAHPHTAEKPPIKIVFESSGMTSFSQSPHQFLEPEGWVPARGYANGMAATGRMVVTGGLVGWNARQEFEHDDLVGQFEQTLRNIVAVLAEAGLSYLGFGAPVTEPSWGVLLQDLQDYLTVYPLAVLWPGLAIILTTMSLNLLSSWMRIALNPTQRWRLEIGGKSNG